MESSFGFKPSLIREGREAKKLAHQTGANIRGKTPEVFINDIAPALKSRVDEAVKANRTWLKAEFRKVVARMRGKKPTSLDAMLPHFQKTVENRFRLFARAQGQSVEAMGKDVNIYNVLCEQAAFDFILSLRMSAREGGTYNNAIEFASLSHWLNPSDLKTLTEKYKDTIRPSDIKYILRNHTINPEAFIQTYLQEKERLSKKYTGQVDPYVIDYIALHGPKRLDLSIDHYIKDVARLPARYNNEVDLGVVKHAALLVPSDPDAFIGRYYIRESKRLALAARYKNKTKGETVVHQTSDASLEKEAKTPLDPRRVH